MAAMSQDGYIARMDGDVSWLEDMDVGTNESGFKKFFKNIDALVMGRKTYDFIFNFGSWPYEDKPTWICTHNDLEPLDGANLTITKSIDDVISGANSTGIEHLWLVGGGQLASSFLARGLITNLSITEMPIKLESGIPLFSNHNLKEIQSEERRVIDKGNFRQIEIAIRI